MDLTTMLLAHPLEIDGVPVGWLSGPHGGPIVAYVGWPGVAGRELTEVVMNDSELEQAWLAGGETNVNALITDRLREAVTSWRSPPAAGSLREALDGLPAGPWPPLTDSRPAPQGLEGFFDEFVCALPPPMWPRTPGGRLYDQLRPPTAPGPVLTISTAGEGNVAAQTFAAALRAARDHA